MHRHATRYLMDHVEVVEVDPSAPAEDKPKSKPKKKAPAKKSAVKADDSAKEE